MKFSKDYYIASVERSGRSVGAVIAPQNLSAPVPGCPGWSLERLIGHLGRLYLAVTEQIRTRPADRVPPDRIGRPPEGEAIGEWFRTTHDELLQALATLEPEEEIWSWSAEHTGAFYLRRMAHETAIHCWDAQSAVGVPESLDGDFAADGVDELLGVVLPFMQDLRDAPQPSGSLHLHRTDGEGEWYCWMQKGKLYVERLHKKGDAAVRGTAEQLNLALWERIGLDSLEVIGDREVAEAWMSVST